MMHELDKILEEIREMLEDNKVIEFNSDGTLDKCVIDVKLAWNDIKDIIHKHMNGGWIPVEERSPAGYERIGYDKQGYKYMRRFEIAYMTDTIEYVHGYYDGYKWMDEWCNIIENVVAWKIHEPYRPERIKK